MKRDLLLGKYIPGTSLYHQLDARAKMLVMLSCVIMVALSQTWLNILRCFIVFFIFLVCSKLPLSLFKRQILFLKWLYLVLIIISPLAGIFQSVKLILVVLFGALFTFTTSPSQVAAMFPAHSLFGFQLSLCLRLIPMVMDETRRIYQAQVSRGLDFSELTLKESISKLGAIIIPAIATTVNKLVNLCDVLECRGFKIGSSKTSIHLSRVGVCEVCVVAIVWYNVCMILLARM